MSTSSVVTVELTDLSNTHTSTNAGPHTANATVTADVDGQDAVDVADAGARAQSLPPIDGGKQAWMFLAASFLCEFTYVGSAFSWSVFQSYLSRSPSSPLHDQSNVLISAIGTLLFCMIYFTPAFAQPVFAYFPRYMRTLTAGALVLAVMCLFAASFMSSAGSLIAFTGFGLGLGCGLATTTYVLWLPQWFSARRSLAYGISFSGAGAGGVVFPFIFTSALDRFGFAWTMRIWAGLLLCLGGTALLFIKPRLPVASARAGSARAHGGRAILREWDYLASPLWLLSAFLTFVSSAGYFAVSFYLATYCASLGLSTAASTGAVAAFNAASLTGEITVGFACDHMRYTTVMLFVSTVATLSSVLLFGFAHSLAFIVAFTLLFGLAAGSWCATWGPSALDVARARNAQSANVVLSFAVVRGAAALVGPLVAAALYEPQRAGERVPFGSFGFAPLIAFVGACMLAVTALVLPTEAARRTSLRDVDVRAFRERL